jgi:hypothetical protein
MGRMMMSSFLKTKGNDQYIKRGAKSRTRRETKLPVCMGAEYKKGASECIQKDKKHTVCEQKQNPNRIRTDRTHTHTYTGHMQSEYVHPHQLIYHASCQDQNAPKNRRENT